MTATDTLIEHTFIRRPQEPDKLYAVRFTEWTQALVLCALLDADSFQLSVSLPNDGPRFDLFSVTFHYADARAPVILLGGDYLVTNDVAGSVDRYWRPMSKTAFSEFERYGSVTE